MRSIPMPITPAGRAEGESAVELEIEVWIKSLGPLGWSFGRSWLGRRVWFKHFPRIIFVYFFLLFSQKFLMCLEFLLEFRWIRKRRLVLVGFLYFFLHHLTYQISQFCLIHVAFCFAQGFSLPYVSCYIICYKRVVGFVL